MKVLVTGGKGKIASNIHSRDSINFLKPGREMLDLGETNSILKYTESNPDVDGIILNGWQFHSDVFNKWGSMSLDNDNYLENLEWVPGKWQQHTMINYFSSQLLLRRYYKSLKFIFFLNTDTSNRKYHHYSNEKLMVNDLFCRLTKETFFKHIKYISAVPSAMVDKHLTGVGKNLVDMVGKLDTLQTRKEYFVNHSEWHLARSADLYES